MIDSLKLILPEIFLSASALLLLVLDVTLSRRRKPWVVFCSLASVLITAILVIYSPQGQGFGVMVSDSFSAFFKILALTGAALTVLLSEKDPVLMGKHSGTYASMILLSTAGAMFLASSEDLLLVFIALELTTLPLFILAGFERNELRSSEGAIKFFLMGAFSTGIALFGISLLYGLCGSTHFVHICGWVLSPSFNESHMIFFLGILFLIVGLGFKMTLAPFHQWAPDTYEGSPTPITAFFSISREAGVIVVVLRFFSEFVNISSAGLTHFFAILSVLTMTLGNVSALRQDSLKRLLAYSSVAHAGTLLIGLISANQLGREGVMLYSWAYSLMSLGAFAIVIAVSRTKNSDDISNFRGLARKDFWLALAMLLFLASLAGIPPTLGFWGKFYVFSAAIDSKMYWLVAAGLVNSVISVFYYFRIAQKMFFEQPAQVSEAGSSATNNVGLSIGIASCFSLAAILLLGIFPQEFLSWIRMSAHLFRGMRILP